MGIMVEPSIEYENVRDDLVAFNIFDLEHSSTWTKALRRSRVGVVAAALLVGFVIFAVSGWRWHFAVSTVIAAVIAVPLCARWSRSRAHRLLREHVEEVGDGGFAGVHRLLLRADGLYEE